MPPAPTVLAMTNKTRATGRPPQDQLRAAGAVAEIRHTLLRPHLLLDSHERQPIPPSVAAQIAALAAKIPAHVPAGQHAPFQAAIARGYYDTARQLLLAG
jgi:hypothetical protein